MRQFIIILQFIVGILLALIIFVGLIAQGSGHNIPLGTNVFFVATSLILVALLFISSYIKRKIK
jgi:hypothetical protein